jgi:hypothetical protein
MRPRPDHNQMTVGKVTKGGGTVGAEPVLTSCRRVGGTGQLGSVTAGVRDLVRTAHFS